MKAETKKAKLAELLGIEIPTEGKRTEQQTASREAEAVLAYYEDSSTFAEKMCKYCEQVFAVNRGCVAYCSDKCRTKALADIGIDWDSAKPVEERWALYQGSKQTAEPLTVPPSALAVLKSQRPPDAEKEYQGDSLPVTEPLNLETHPWESVLAELD